MIRSEILDEKDKVQTRLSGESDSIQEYMIRAHQEASRIAEQRGFKLKYAELANKPVNSSKQ